MMSEIDGRKKVVSEALTWLRTPYHHRGRVKGVGADCLTFPAGVAENAGVTGHIDIPAYHAQFGLHRNEETYLAGLLDYAREIEGPSQPGDLVLWRFGRVFSHAALVVEWPTIIHADTNSGVVLADAESGDLKYMDSKGSGLKVRPRKFFSYW